MEKMEEELKPPPGKQAPPVIKTGKQAAYMYSTEQPQVVQPVGVTECWVGVFITVNQVVIQCEPTEVPGLMKCPSCRTIVTTRTEYKNGMLTWLICGVLGVLLIWPFCLIPLCVNSCKDVQHYCPTCDRALHVYNRHC